MAPFSLALAHPRRQHFGNSELCHILTGQRNQTTGSCQLAIDAIRNTRAVLSNHRFILFTVSSLTTLVIEDPLFLPQHFSYYDYLLFSLEVSIICD